MVCGCCGCGRFATGVGSVGRSSSSCVSAAARAVVVVIVIVVVIRVVRVVLSSSTERCCVGWVTASPGGQSLGPQWLSLFLGLVLGFSSGWLNVQGVGFGVGVVAPSFGVGLVGPVEGTLLLLSPLFGCADVSSFLLGGIIITVVVIVIIVVIVTALPMKVWVCWNGTLICCSLSPVGCLC